ncbi:lipocalin family protein [Flavobacterium sedimenticola]|uniref:Lipocalin family protein n=1 Tax=Flavobacterium sedimenticola TaxID=3043286 RepID=A0ABT6XQV4_9FLAO|nr:lipocalin family protein [Flavobacterium sedimenticola]MDI9257403.1 lipocalin family protein [Flavobacterium sedimenticola]
MKKIILLSVVSVLFLSCKSTNSATNTKVDSQSQTAIKGEWVISSVNYPGSEVIKVTSFDLADSKCFIGSKWKFVSMSNKGSMALNSPNCTAYSTPITWFINKEGEFVLKILDEAKAKTVKSGYVLRVANQTERSFQLVDQINVAGKMTAVVYQFDKVN